MSTQDGEVPEGVGEAYIGWIQALSTLTFRVRLVLKSSSMFELLRSFSFARAFFMTKEIHASLR